MFCLIVVYLFSVLICIAGLFASLDVFKKEPLPKNSKLWKNQNITVTPHVAAITDVDSSINYIFSKFEQFRTNGKIKSDVKIKNGY